MKRRGFFLALILLAAAASPGRAELIAALKPGLVPKSVFVLDERDQKKDFLQTMTGSGPVLLLPIFTKCRASCPVMAEALKTALSKKTGAAPFRVALFSFDAMDQAEDLRMFREMEEIPAEWLLVRPVGAAQSREFLDQFSYSFMDTNAGFVHPNELFVLSGSGRWSGILSGTEFKTEELEAAYRDADDWDHPTLQSRLRQAARNPENWAIFGGSGLLIVCLAVMTLALRRPRNP